MISIAASHVRSESKQESSWVVAAAWRRALRLYALPLVRARVARHALRKSAVQKLVVGIVGEAKRLNVVRELNEAWAERLAERGELVLVLQGADLGDALSEHPWKAVF